MNPRGRRISLRISILDDVAYTLQQLFRPRRDDLRFGLFLFGDALHEAQDHVLKGQDVQEDEDQPQQVAKTADKPLSLPDDDDAYQPGKLAGHDVWDQAPTTHQTYTPPVDHYAPFTTMAAETDVATVVPQVSFPDTLIITTTTTTTTTPTVTTSPVTPIPPIPPIPPVAPVVPPSLPSVTTPTTTPSATPAAQQSSGYDGGDTSTPVAQKLPGIYVCVDQTVSGGDNATVTVDGQGMASHLANGSGQPWLNSYQVDYVSDTPSADSLPTGLWAAGWQEVVFNFTVLQYQSWQQYADVVVDQDQSHYGISADVQQYTWLNQSALVGITAFGEGSTLHINTDAVIYSWLYQYTNVNVTVGSLTAPTTTSSLSSSVTAVAAPSATTSGGVATTGADTHDTPSSTASGDSHATDHSATAGSTTGSSAASSPTGDGSATAGSTAGSSAASSPTGDGSATAGSTAGTSAASSPAGDGSASDSHATDSHATDSHATDSAVAKADTGSAPLPLSTDVTQHVWLTQDVTLLYNVQDGLDLNLEALLGQIVTILHSVAVSVEIKGDQITVTLCADQGADLTQSVSLALSMDGATAVVSSASATGGDTTAASHDATAVSHDATAAGTASTSPSAADTAATTTAAGTTSHDAATAGSGSGGTGTATTSPSTADTTATTTAAGTASHDAATTGSGSGGTGTATTSPSTADTATTATAAGTTSHDAATTGSGSGGTGTADATASGHGATAQDSAAADTGGATTDDMSSLLHSAFVSGADLTFGQFYDAWAASTEAAGNNNAASTPSTTTPPATTVTVDAAADTSGTEVPADPSLDPTDDNKHYAAA
jgi:hypothetical protein